LAVRAKLTHDFAGHYNRPDVFQLRLNTLAPQLLSREAWQHQPAEFTGAGEALPLARDEEDKGETLEERDSP
jgi:aliphatic nitrilase